MYRLMLAVVPSGKGSKILSEAREAGVRGGTILLGHGGVENKILEFLMLDDVKKEVVFMAMQSSLEERVAPRLGRIFKLDRPHHGILLTLPLGGLYGTHEEEEESLRKREEEKMQHEAIFIIVDRGKADEVIEAAGEEGSRGATVIHARGSGIHEEAGLFNFTIEPEKEMILIVAQREHSEEIIERIRRDFHIDEPGKGIIFTLPTTRVLGLRT